MLILVGIHAVNAQNIKASGSCFASASTLTLRGDANMQTSNSRPVYYNAAVSVNYETSTISSQVYLYFALAAELGTAEDRWVISLDGEPYYYFISSALTPPSGEYLPFDAALPTTSCGGSVTVTYAFSPVTQVWSNYSGFWTSSTSAVNAVRPDNDHDLLAFNYGSTVFSTGVNDTKLTTEGVVFSAQVYKAFPINSMPVGPVASYFAGFGQLKDGIDNGLISPQSNFFNATSGFLASLLTDGVNGLNMGTGLANIPSGTVLNFSLGTNGITAASIDDGVPDLLFLETATPSPQGDRLKFVDALGNVVGTEYSFILNDLTRFPKFGEWLPDFYALGAQANLTKAWRPLSMVAIDFKDLGINSSNYSNATKLVYTTSGDADPAFVAFRELSVSLPSKMAIVSQPTEYNSDSLLRTSITVQINDANGLAVDQANTPVTVSISSGTGSLSGTTTRNTNATGLATFDDLKITGTGAHTLRFSSSGLTSDTSSSISPASATRISVTSLPPFTYCTGTASEAASFTVSGIDLESDITLTAPAGFEMSSTSSSGGYSTTLALTPTVGALASTTIYVRVASTTTNAPVGNIAISATGVTTRNIAIRASTNNALSFDGANNNYVDLGTPVSTRLTNNFSISAWVKTSLTSQRTFFTNQWVYHTSGVLIGLTASGYFHIALANSTGTWAAHDPNVFVSDNKWHYLTITFASGTLKSYVDGIFVDSYATGVSAVSYNGTSHFLIGKDSGAGGEYWNGLVDEVTMWNKVLTAPEISNYMNTPPADTAANLVGYWDFNSGVAEANNAGVTTLYDRTSNAINGTLMNMSLTGTGSNWVKGHMPVITGTDSVYTGYTTQFANGYTGGQWSSSNTALATISSTGLVTGVAAGTVTITYSLCGNAVTRSVRVKSRPNAPTSGSNQVVCEQSPIQTLTATATAPGGSTVVWYDAETEGNVVLLPTLNAVGTITYYAASKITGTSFYSSGRTAVSLTINAAPTVPTSGGDQAVCEQSPLQTLTATATTASTLVWYDSSSAGNVVASPTRNTTGTITYYAAAQNSTSSCYSLSRAAVSLTINPAPTAPTSGGNQAVCEQSPLQTLTATATTASTLIWYDSSSAGNVVVSPTKNTTGTITYYAAARNSSNSCYSVNRTAVALTINPAPAAPTGGSDQAVCEQSPLQTLTATATTASTLVWYDSSSAGNIVASPTRNTTGTITYYAAAQNSTSSCYSLSRAAVSLTINPAPTAPTSGGNQAVCEQSPLQTLTATATTASTLVWYDSSSAGNIVVSPTKNTTGTITYYAAARNSSNSCYSVNRTAVALTINPAPGSPSAVNVSVPWDGSPHTGDATVPAGSTLLWYTLSTGGTSTVAPVGTAIGNYSAYAVSTNTTTLCSSLSRTQVTVAINKATTTTVLTMSAGSLRYKDYVTLTAVITPQNASGSLSGSVVFKIGTITYGSASVIAVPGAIDGKVQAQVVVQVNELPSTYVATACFTSSNANYEGSTSLNKTLVVTARTATPSTAAASFYNGTVFAWTPGTNSGTATVLLAASLKDNNSPAGDIRAARVTFYYVLSTGALSPITGATNLPVGLVDVSDGTVGTASASVQLSIGSLTSSSWTIAVGVSGGYTNNPNDVQSQAIVTVSKPITTGYIVGGGTISNNSNSAGFLKSNAANNSWYGFNVTYTKSGTNPKGAVWLTFGSWYSPSGQLDTRLHTYRVTSTAISTFNTVTKSSSGYVTATATFTSKANLVEVLENGTIVSIEGGSNLQIVVANNCPMGIQQLAVTLFRKAGGIWFANNWNGTSAVLQQVNNDGSKVFVAGASLCQPARVSMSFQEPALEPVIGYSLSAVVFPNPTSTSFKLHISGNSKEVAEIQVFDLWGHLKNKMKAAGGETVSFGSGYIHGVYFVHIIQGEQKKVIKAIK